MEKTCFLCGYDMDTETGLCKNPNCVRSKPLPAPNAGEKADETKKEKNE